MLAFGLPPESRVMRKLSGHSITLDQMLMATACDNLSMLTWLHTDSARHGKNRPRLILPELTADQSGKPQAYADGAAFIAARNAILGRCADGD